MEDELLTTKEVAKILKAEQNFVFKLINSGELPVVRRGTRYTRIMKSDLVMFIQRHRQVQGNKNEQERG